MPSLHGQPRIERLYRLHPPHAEPVWPLSITGGFKCDSEYVPVACPVPAGRLPAALGGPASGIVCAVQRDHLRSCARHRRRRRRRITRHPAARRGLGASGRQGCPSHRRRFAGLAGRAGARRQRRKATAQMFASSWCLSPRPKATNRGACRPSRRFPSWCSTRKSKPT